MKSLFVESTARISDCGLYRYVLVRRWDRDKDLVCWVMLNPSTADAMTDDPTIRRCTGFAESWGYGGICVINLFAFRSTHPQQLRTVADPVGPENDASIMNHAYGRLVVAAWGSMGEYLGRGEKVLAMIRSQGVKVFHLGLTQGGQPKHPLYLPADLKPIAFPGEVEKVA